MTMICRQFVIRIIRILVLHALEQMMSTNYSIYKIPLRIALASTWTKLLSIFLWAEKKFQETTLSPPQSQQQRP